MTSTGTKRQAPKLTSSHGIPGNFLVAVSAWGASPSSIQLQLHLRNLRSYYQFPASSIVESRYGRFRRLARQWREETQWLSSTSEIAMHPAYQSIIGMGAEALPWIVRELRSGPGNWYWALKSISNEDPVPPEDRGVIAKMKAAWLRWANAKGISTYGPN